MAFEAIRLPVPLATSSVSVSDGQVIRTSSVGTLLREELVRMFGAERTSGGYYLLNGVFSTASIRDAVNKALSRLAAKYGGSVWSEALRQAAIGGAGSPGSIVAMFRLVDSEVTPALKTPRTLESGTPVDLQSGERKAVLVRDVPTIEPERRVVETTAAEVRRREEERKKAIEAQKQAVQTQTAPQAKTVLPAPDPIAVGPAVIEKEPEPAIVETPGPSVGRLALIGSLLYWLLK